MRSATQRIEPPPPKAWRTARLALARCLAIAACGLIWLSAAVVVAEAPAVAAPGLALPTPLTALAAEAPTEKPSPVVVEASLEPLDATFGAKVELVVRLRYPPDVRTFFPGRPDLKPLLALPADPGRSERVERDGVVHETLRIPALVARTGLLRTPRIEVPWHRASPSGAASESGTAVVPQLSLTVRSGLGDELEPAPAPLPTPLPLVEDNTPLRVALLVLAMMIVGGALTFVALRVLRDRFRSREPEPVIPPHVLAFGRLEALQRSGRLERDEPRLLYGELSEILRAYLGGRYRMLALDMTSTELLEALQGRDLGGLTLSEFSDFTAEGDLVKFARLPLTPDELTARLGWVRRVIERTMQTPEELERQRTLQIARLARQRRLRVQVMAPAQLRVAAFAIDAALGAACCALIAWLAIDTDRRGLFDAAYGLMLVWMALRDVLGDGSPGKTWLGLRIAEWDPNGEVDPDAQLQDDFAARAASQGARTATVGQRIQRNALLLLPGAGLVAEALTMFRMPELRRIGDLWACTRVIDGRFGLRRRPMTWLPSVLLGAAALALLALPLLVGGRPQ